MWSIGPTPPDPPGCDVPRADAKSRPCLQGHDESPEGRRKRRRKRDQTEDSFEIDTFEPSAERDSGE